MNTAAQKSRWLKWLGFCLALLTVAALAAGTTYWLVRPNRMAKQQARAAAWAGPAEFGDMRASLKQLRQLQEEMDQMFAADLDPFENTQSIHPQHPRQVMAQMQQLFHQMGMDDRPFDPAGTFDEGWNMLDISPAINMRPEKDRLVLTVTLPQTEKKDVRVVLNGDVLKISAERQSATASPDAHSTHQAHSHFSQQIRLPAIPAQPEAIDATFENNVLRVVIPLPGMNPPRETQVPVQ